ncbi:hypothetical protein ACFOZ0_26905 [Streptomyces yaanensis]|uniref:Secreted protein n=1 Tax=Streptomyces yaanensis TaxID=1142239 RepID=A0ABV7SIS4_9ACTN|nr:hypothetical protein [Streptomyces sp. CGMCC 4.7035]WNB97142.1 hypothetical protein Q2K21_03110 [Streptomyces sp. CGMCC 4.7035]
MYTATAATSGFPWLPVQPRHPWAPSPGKPRQPLLLVSLWAVTSRRLPLLVVTVVGEVAPATVTAGIGGTKEPVVGGTTGWLVR